MPTSELHPNTDAQTYCIVASCFTSVTGQVCNFGPNVFVFEWHGIIKKRTQEQGFLSWGKSSLLFTVWKYHALDWTQTRNWPKFLSVVPFKGIMTKQLQKGSNLRQNLFSTRKIWSLSHVHLPQKVSGTQEERRNQVCRKVESRASKQNGWCQRRGVKGLEGCVERMWGWESFPHLIPTKSDLSPVLLTDGELLPSSWHSYAVEVSDSCSADAYFTLHTQALQRATQNDRNLSPLILSADHYIFFWTEFPDSTSQNSVCPVSVIDKMQW